MAKASMKSNPPVVRIAPAPTDAKRQGDFVVNDIVTTINQLNTQIAKAARVDIAIEVGVGVDSDGVTQLRLMSATRS